jgi:23S rRNA (adenine-N6)-dimethyltransferase
VGAKGPRSRPARSRPSGRHLLRSSELAREIVAAARLSPGERVLEIGAGTGRLTAALVDAGANVLAVEIDERSVAALGRRFADAAGVEILYGDVLVVPLPRTPYRAFGNIPFGVTTAILRRLLDPVDGPLRRADLIVQYDVGRKRSAVWPSDLLSLGWLPWWEIHLERRLPGGAFDPPPSVDAAVLSIVRREPPLLSTGARADYLSLVRSAFRRANVPVDRAVRGIVEEGVWRRIARQRGDVRRSRASDLDVFTWTAVYRQMRRLDPD